MKKTINQIAQFGFVLVRALFCFIIVIAAFTVTVFSLATDSADNYLEKIIVYSDDESLTFRNTVALRESIATLYEKSERMITDDNSPNSSDDTLVNVVIRFDYDYKETTEYAVFLDERNFLMTQFDVDDFRQRLAVKSRAYHEKMNAMYLSNIDFNAEVEKIAYSPFIMLRSENEEIIYNDVISFAQDRNVESIVIQKQKSILDEQSTGIRRYLNDEERLEETGGTEIVANGLYTGDDVKIGICEVNYPRQGFFDNMIFHSTPTTTDSHAEIVCAMLRTVAPDATIYISDIVRDEDGVDFSWYIENLVPVINCSWGSTTYYTNSYEGHIDYQIATHFISVVKSAGNRGLGDRLITSPGYGRNMVTVTGTETVMFSTGEKQVSIAPNASYLQPTGYNVPKPTLAAPFYVTLRAPNSSGGWSTTSTAGTSLSAPQVTGALALLFEKYPALSTRPEEVLARLQASANHEGIHDYDSITGLANRDERVGAGILNIERLLNGTVSDNYLISNNQKQGQNITEREIHLNEGDVFKANLHWLGRYSHDVPTANSYVTNYDLRLYNPNNSLVAQSNSQVSYSETIIYNVPVSGTYRLVVHQTGAFNGHANDMIGLAYSNPVSSIGVPYTTAPNATGLTITGIDGAVHLPDTIIIPDQINGINVTQIGIYAFQGRSGVKNIIFADRIKKIDSYAFENCIDLNGITLPKNLATIGNSAFKGCSNLRHVIIPANVANIYANAFANCTYLENVIVLREKDSITNLGANAFAGCNSLDTITVPQNKILDYKNAPNWTSYSALLKPDGPIPVNTLNCLSDFAVPTYLNAGYSKVYKLDVECAKSYKITSTANAAIKMSLYDTNMHLLPDTPVMSNNNRQGVLTIYLSPGTYYLKLCFESNSTSGTINTTYKLTWPTDGWRVYYNTDNDVLTHLHRLEENHYQNRLYYINNEGPRFFKITLTGENPDGSAVYYPEGAITVYDNSSMNYPMDKFTLTGYSNLAQTKEDANSMVVYLPRNGYFYINVNMTSNEFSSLQLRISPVESQEIDLFALSETDDEDVDIFAEESTGDYFKALYVEQTGKFTITPVYNGAKADNVLFVLIKMGDPLETKIIQLIGEGDTPYPVTRVLEDGKYYIGYFNKSGADSFSVSFKRLITQYGSHVLVTDPDPWTPCGSQINIIEMNDPNKSYRQAFITQHFTRLIYPDYNYGVPASRLEYYWYSSNEGIATVTQYGTVLGKSVGAVKIMAVVKDDPSKVFVKEFTIVKDTATEPLEVHSTYTVKYSETDNGIFKLKLETVNCPYPMFQDYSWSIYVPCQEYDISASMGQWGYITVSGPGYFILTGRYLKNPRVSIVITVSVQPL